MAGAQPQANKIVREVCPNSVFESALNVIDSTVTFNQGDLLYFNSGLITRLTAESQGNLFVGIARVSITSGKLNTPYSTPTLTPAIQDIPGPQFGVVAQLQLANSQSFTPGLVVYADPLRGNSNVATTGTKVIGVYQGPSVTAGAASYGPVYLGCRYPEDTLKF